MTALLVIGLIVYIIYSEQRYSRLRDRIDKLEPRPIPLAPRARPTASSLESPLSTQSNINISNPPSSLSMQTEVTSDSLDQLWRWLVHDWPIKVGALFILLSTIWFISYAFLNNWIGPVGRITLGLIAGAVTMLLGHWYATRQRHQGLVIELLGTVISLVTIFAAQNLYQMFPSLAALGLAVAVMVTLTYSSLKYQDKYLASFALIIGGIAPLLTGSYEPNIAGLFSYLIALTIGSLWLSAFTNWRHLTVINLGVVWLYSLTYQSSNLWALTPGEITQLKFFAVSFVSLFFTANLATIYKSHQAQTSDLITALAISLYSFLWIISLVNPEWQSLALLSLSLGFLFGAYLIGHIGQSPYPVYTYSAAALFLLTSAAMIEFDGPIEVISLSLIATLIPLVSVRLFTQQISSTLLLYFAIPIALSFPSVTSSQWRTGIYHNDAAALVGLTICLWVVGLYLRYNLPQKLQPLISELKNATTAAIVTASIYTLTLIWLVNHATFPQTFFARMLTIAIYLIVGLFTYFYGQLTSRHVTHRYGQILTISVIAWLLLVETSSMELTGRILTFALTGALLMGSVILLNRFKKK